MAVRFGSFFLASTCLAGFFDGVRAVFFFKTAFGADFLFTALALVCLAVFFDSGFGDTVRLGFFFGSVLARGFLFVALVLVRLAALRDVFLPAAFFDGDFFKSNSMVSSISMPNISERSDSAILGALAFSALFSNL